MTPRAPLRWHALRDAAAILGVSQDALRKQLERKQHRASDGVVEASSTAFARGSSQAAGASPSGSDGVRWTWYRRVANQAVTAVGESPDCDHSEGRPEQYAPLGH